MTEGSPLFPSRRCHVLLVDDDPDSREMYAFFLRAAGYAVHEASDGGEALEIAAELGPDVVVMDLSLPLVDGYTAIGRLAAHPQTSAIPIVVLSAHTFPDDERRARDAGAAAFLAKPCHPDLLAQTVRRVSESCEAAFSALPAPGPVSGAPAPGAPAAGAPAARL